MVCETNTIQPDKLIDKSGRGWTRTAAGGAEEEDLLLPIIRFSSAPIFD